MTSIVPAVVENHLDAIHCTEDGKILLSSSNLTGRYWNGSLWCFPSVEDAPNVEKCLTGIEVSSGISDFVCLQSDRIVLGLDSGGLEIYKLESEPTSFSQVLSFCEHDDSISSLSVNADKASVVSAGADKCIKVWDVETWAATATYRPVHGGIIWQVSCSTEDRNVFITCGQDGKIILFDLRLPKPATLIDSSPLKGEPTSICWRPGNPSSFAVGDDSGLVALKDTRQNGSVSTWDAHRRRIYKLLFPKSQPWLAACADDTNVCVANIEGEIPSLIYKDDSHDDFVRGLTWTVKNELISCGWDKKVVHHICKADKTS